MKRIALAIGAGIVATGAVVASAASLGTLNVKTLGTSSAVVDGCAASGIAVSWNDTAPVYVGNGTAANSTYNTTDMKLNVPVSCNGAAVKLVVAGTGGVELANSTGTVNTGSNTLTLSAPVNSKDIIQTTVTLYNQT